MDIEDVYLEDTQPVIIIVAEQDSPTVPQNSIIQIEIGIEIEVYAQRSYRGVSGSRFLC